MNKKPYLSVVIPCYNEKENLERGVLDEVYDFLRKQDFLWEVIISDDGSTDESRELVAKQIKGKNNFRLIENPHGGKPSAVWGGIKNANGEYVLFTDMDQSAPIEELKKLMPFFDEYDVIIGSRGMERENFSLLRKVGSNVFRLVRKSLMLRRINDTQCGFKAFKTKVAKEIFPLLQFFKTNETIKGWKVTSFDVELLFIAEKFGYKIKEVKVTWKDRDVSTGKKKSYLKESQDMLKQIFRVKLNDIKGMYHL
ncbi:glycosyltransferase [Candidatus Microgenomates bacterium]|jgi:glycosyltransferase involved in cell wall biosynthesis|nr:MAG: glycosyltransferase [Candidatus Microgenomates bacterium]